VVIDKIATDNQENFYLFGFLVTFLPQLSQNLFPFCNMVIMLHQRDFERGAALGEGIGDILDGDPSTSR
jgi:hypothetical protein